MRVALLGVLSLALALSTSTASAQMRRAGPDTAGPVFDDIVTSVPGLPPLGLTGAAAFDNFGYSVAPAGDVNGDGFADFIVGALGNGAGGSNAGRAYVHFGGLAMDAVADVTLTGAAAGDQFGTAVAGAGDVNGDGYDDVVVGAPFSDAAGSNAGRAYVFFGGAAMDATPDVVFTGAAIGDQLGFAVAGAGDMNADGFADVVVGAPYHDTGGNNRGRAYLYLGGLPMDATSDAIYKAGSAGDQLGHAVSSVGDVNGDGFGDLVVGAPANSTGGSQAGRAYVYFGGTTVDNAPDVILTGGAGDQLGSAVSGAGDANGDGFGDLVVGAPYDNTGGSGAGQALVFFGGAAMDDAVDVILLGAAGDALGYAVGGGGDIDGDGFDDVVAGGWASSASGFSLSGRASVYLGGAAMDGVADVMRFGTAYGQQVGIAVAVAGDLDGDGRADFLVGANGDANSRGRVFAYQVRLTGEDLPDLVSTGATGDYHGLAAASAGDVNGDGYDDWIVGAPYNDAGGGNAGRAYLYFGGPGADAVPDVTLTGAAAGDQFGRPVAGAGDVNGDGYDDVIVGATLNDAGGSNAGRVYVYFGGAAMNNGADLLLTGESAADNFGYAVAGAGDVNGDGYADLVVGAPYNDAADDGAGRAYVYFGGAAMNSVVDVTFTGTLEFENLGVSVAGAGDIDGDGFDDVIVGAPNSNVAGVPGAFVYLGGATMNSLADLSLTGEAPADAFGVSVNPAGDVNGDGYADVVVGAYFNDAGGVDAGRAYLYFGGPAADAVPDVTLTGAAAGDGFGFAVAGAGDVNGDGYADVIVGAPFNAGAGAGAGRATVYFGGVAMDNIADVRMTGESSGDVLGAAVAGAGDVNGDGAADLVVGAPYSAAAGSDAGRAYVFLSTYPAAAPHLAAVRDVPDDQGGFVSAEWTASAFDGHGDARVTSYLVERSRPAGSGPLFWEPVATVPATANAAYSASVPTYGVPAEGTSLPVRVRVTAQSPAGDRFRSAVATGASIDNLAPPAPLGLAVAPEAVGYSLAWSAVVVPDLDGYAVYRAATSGAPADSTTLVAVVDGPAWTDAAAAPGEAWVYRVAARDVNGNEGAPSAEVSTMSVGTEAGGLPTAFALTGVSPNPARGSAVVSFALPVSSRVRVVVYDVQGREVAVVVEADRSAGYHTSPVSVRGLSSGTYVVRMSAGSFAAVQSLTVVR